MININLQATDKTYVSVGKATIEEISRGNALILKKESDTEHRKFELKICAWPDNEGAAVDFKYGNKYVKDSKNKDMLTASATSGSNDGRFRLVVHEEGLAIKSIGDDKNYVSYKTKTEEGDPVLTGNITKMEDASVFIMKLTE